MSDNESDKKDDLHIQKLENLEKASKYFLFLLKEITPRKYITKVTLIFWNDFKILIVALFDIGVYLNYIKHGFFPKCFHNKKTKNYLL